MLVFFTRLKLSHNLFINPCVNARNVDNFLTLVRKYTDIKELTPEIIREFVEKIYVYKAERIDGRRVQRIKIVWNCIGEFEPPVSTSTTKNEKSA